MQTLAIQNSTIRHRCILFNSIYNMTDVSTKVGDSVMSNAHWALYRSKVLEISCKFIEISSTNLVLISIHFTEYFKRHRENSIIVYYSTFQFVISTLKYKQAYMLRLSQSHSLLIGFHQLPSMNSISIFNEIWNRQKLSIVWVDYDSIF